MKEFVGILHNIRSIHNVASMFRTADGAGVSKLYLCGITPTPTDRFGKIREQFKKVSLGAEKFVSWEYISSTLRLLARLKKEKFRVYVLEQNARAVNYRKVRISSAARAVLVVGNEVRGVPKSILSKADTIIEIPMHGEKESLNVAVAFGVAVFRIAEH